MWRNKLNADVRWPSKNGQSVYRGSIIAIIEEFKIIKQQYIFSFVIDIPRFGYIVEIRNASSINFKSVSLSTLKRCGEIRNGKCGRYASFRKA